MNKTIFFTLMVVGLFFASCGGGSNESNDTNSEESISLTPKSTHIKGDLGDYFEVEDKEYTTVHDLFDVISIEVKRNDTPLPFDPKSDGVRSIGTYGAGITTLVGFGLELYDENGNVVDKISTGDFYSHDDILEAIKLKSGETGIIRFSIHIKEKNKPTQFVMTSSIEKVTPSDDSDNEDISDNSDNGDTESDYSSHSSAGSTDWDAVLDSYERYVDKYVTLYKKANNGDLDALTDYNEYMQEALELNEKLSNAKGELSTKQIARLNKINLKMSKAAM